MEQERLLDSKAIAERLNSLGIFKEFIINEDAILSETDFHSLLKDIAASSITSSTEKHKSKEKRVSTTFLGEFKWKS